MRIRLIRFYVKKENQTNGLEERKIWVNFSYLATSLAKKKTDLANGEHAEFHPINE